MCESQMFFSIWKLRHFCVANREIAPILFSLLFLLFPLMSTEPLLPYDPSGDASVIVHSEIDVSKLSAPANDGRVPIVLVSCGSFSPPTVLHLRLFEAIRNHFADSKTHQVVGGFISPVHDAYGKKGLIESKHRHSMCQRAVSSSDWIAVDGWEIVQGGWTRTRRALQHLKQRILAANGMDVTPLLICGADLLESFLAPGVWIPEDIDAILASGVACVVREGVDLDKLIFNSDVLYKYRRNIHIVHPWVENNVPSTIVRRLLKRGLSVKYLVQDEVLNYITEHRLYQE